MKQRQNTSIDVVQLGDEASHVPGRCSTLCQARVTRRVRASPAAPFDPKTDSARPCGRGRARPIPGTSLAGPAPIRTRILQRRAGGQASGRQARARQRRQPAGQRSLTETAWWLGERPRRRRCARPAFEQHRLIAEHASGGVGQARRTEPLPCSNSIVTRMVRAEKELKTAAGQVNRSLGRDPLRDALAGDGRVDAIFAVQDRAHTDDRRCLR